MCSGVSNPVGQERRLVRTLTGGRDAVLHSSKQHLTNSFRTPKPPVRQFGRWPNAYSMVHTRLTQRPHTPLIAIPGGAIARESLMDWGCYISTAAGLMRIIKSPDTDRVGRNFAHYVYINALLITFFAARNNSTKGDQKVPHRG